MQISTWFIIFGCIGIINYQGLYYDLLGISQYGRFDPIDLPHLKQLELSGEDVGHFMTKSKEFPYDWGCGHIIYVTFLSAIFGGTIVLEGKEHIRFSGLFPKPRCLAVSSNHFLGSK